MKNLYQILIILSYIIIPFPLFGQIDFGQIAPQTSEFLKYGEIPVSLYTGKVNYEIPVYHLKDKDFDFPISIVYTSDGFKPNKQQSLVGLDWFLNFGGVVTREVYGAPDDSEGQFGDNSNPIGFLNAIKDNKFDKNKIWELDNSILKKEGDNLSLNTTGYFYDWMPDLFSFNFMNHNGQFMIDFDGSVMSNIQGYKIDLSGLTSQPINIGGNSEPYAKNSTIRITSPDGYIYTFGGHTSALEFSRVYKSGGDGIGTLSFGNTTILSWYLSQIESPNGRKLTLIYKKPTTDFIEDSDNIWQVNLTAKDNSIIPYSHKHTYSTTKQAIIESIVVDDTNVKIDFTTSLETEKFYHNNDISDSKNKFSYKLDQIKIFNNSKNLYNFGFEYEYKHRRRFLKSFKQLGGGGTHSFEYDHDTSYPEPSDGRVIDLYQFWIGNLNHKGMLKNIYYPTEGYTSLSYESHTYSSMVETRISGTSGNIIQELVSKNGTNVCGTRIKKIENFDIFNNKLSEKEYMYTNKNNNSSGILLYSLPILGNGNYLVNSIWYSNYSIRDPHIGYSFVKECYPDGSYIVYNYSDFKDYPDMADKYIKKSNTKITDMSLLIASVNKSRSLARMRGLLLNKTYYNPSDVVMQHENYKYRYLKFGIYSLVPKDLSPEANGIEETQNFVVSFQEVLNGAIVKKMFLNYCPLEYKTVTRNNMIIESKTYLYNDQDLMKQEETMINSNDKIKETYKYSYESSRLSTDIKKKLIARNILNLVEEKKKYKGNVCLTTEFNLYKLLRDTLPVIEHVEQSLSNNNLEIRLLYPKYDYYGNPLYIIKDYNREYSYLWGGKGQHLIAEMLNASYDQVENALGFAPELMSTVLYPDVEKIGEILREKLPSSLVSTALHEPLVGTISVTSPNGLKTNYSYNTLGRLSSIKDNKHKKLSSFNYKYANEIFVTDTIAVTSPLDSSDPSLTIQSLSHNSYTNNQYIFYMQSDGARISMEAKASNGSGRYIYKWEATDANNNIICKSDGIDFSFLYYKSGTIHVSCFVMDEINGKCEKKVVSATVKARPIEFQNVTYTSTQAKAEIYCQQATTLTFTLDLSILGSNTASVVCTVGNKTETISTSTTKTFSVPLPAGVTFVKLDLTASRTTAVLAQFILNQTTNGELGNQKRLILQGNDPR